MNTIKRLENLETRMFRSGDPEFKAMIEAFGSYAFQLLRNPLPIIPNLDLHILHAIEAQGGALEMSVWHGEVATLLSVGGTQEADRCGTTHCRAGWAVFLAGDAVKEMEEEWGTGNVATMLYCVSRPGTPIPDWHISNEAAMADIRLCADLYTREPKVGGL